MSQKMEVDGKEIEVFTPEEVTAQIAAATTKAKEDAETEFGKIKTGLETELKDTKTALAERNTEFKNFRELSKDQLAKLTTTEQALYNNQKLLHDETLKREEGEKVSKQLQIDSALRAKAGKDDKLFGKLKELWPTLQIDAVTPEQIEQKTMMILGMINTTQPDLLASVAGFSGGSWTPPGVKQTSGDEKFGETARGKAAANELGLEIEPKKK